MIGILGFVLGFTVYSSLADTFPALLFGINKQCNISINSSRFNYRSYILYNRTLVYR